MKRLRKSYFLPYQSAWLNDHSRLKIWEKSRRIGATYVQAYEDVRDAARATNPMDVWFSSADASAAKEYMRYCAQWARLLDAGARDVAEEVIDHAAAIKALVIEFASGKRIHGLSSNPTAFRSKGGKLVLDEFAFHRDDDALWRAAMPIITWGQPARILSTYNGKGNRYWQMVEEARRGNEWSLHTTTYAQAVAQGLADRISGHPLDSTEREAWIEKTRREISDEEAWQQEYMCQPVDGATAWLPWPLITACEHIDAGQPKLHAGGPCYLGMDIARRGDCTILWVIEQVGDIFWCREVVRLQRARFDEQDAALDRVMRRYAIKRACIDQTGIGEKPVEDAQNNYGKQRIEGVVFTATVKHDLAILGKQLFESQRVRIPADAYIRQSHHAVQRLLTSAGNPRFDAERTEGDHGDAFWAHMLALHAAAEPSADFASWKSSGPGVVHNAVATGRLDRGFGTVPGSLDLKRF
ncbi:MAG: hypothetical protein HQL66_14235 [Magnetococcales bacterium]|nr:hypothetical protein [Magnetococcales bacterium]